MRYVALCPWCGEKLYEPIGNHCRVGVCGEIYRHVEVIRDWSTTSVKGSGPSTAGQARSHADGTDPGCGRERKED